MRLIHVALMALPLEGQHQLARNPEWRVRCSLAASTLTNIEIINTLAHDPELKVRREAWVRTTDLDLIAGVLQNARKGKAGVPIETMYATRNLGALGDLLAEALKSTNKEVTLAAYCNPSTPERSRRGLLSAPIAAAMTATGRHQDDRVIRANELVLANPWMADPEDWRNWSAIVRRAFAASTEATKYAKGAGRLAAHKNNVSIEDMVNLNWVAEDIDTINRDNFTYDEARQMLNRDGRRITVPHVAGRLVNKFGVPVLCDTKFGVHASINNMYPTIAWLAPVLHWYCIGGVVGYPDPVDTINAIKTLGDEPKRWEMFINLLPHWHGTLSEAAEASDKL